MGRGRAHTADLRGGESWEWEWTGVYSLLLLKREGGLERVVTSARAGLGTVVMGRVPGARDSVRFHLQIREPRP